MRKYWVAFSSIEQINGLFVKALYDEMGSIESAWNISETKLKEIEGIKRTQIKHFLNFRVSVNPAEKLDFIKERGIGVITFEDENYPKLLKNIYNPPMTLFYKGDIARCNLDKTLAVVGSRRASESAKTSLGFILDELKNTDITIVSGLASGIDTVAHEGAIRNNLKTIAVIGSGFDYIYPSSNKALYKTIEDHAGVILTEYWPSFAPLPVRFPQRNRIVSGLSYGTLVAEAAMRSGALVTANLTLEQGRELMCMPGALNNPNTQGIYHLLKNGAKLVIDAEDILDALNWEIKRNDNLPKDCHSPVDLTEDEKQVMDIIGPEPLNLDNILNLCNLNISDLMVILTQLEIKGFVKQLDGERYTPAIKL